MLRFSSPAFATGQILVVSDHLTPTAETVLVSYRGQLSFGSCRDFNFWCWRTTVTIRVTPFPPGVPCVGGAYTITATPSSAITPVTLEFGTTYSFSGQSKLEVGYVNVNPCTYSCSSTSNLGTTSYHTADGPLHWEITPLLATVPATWGKVKSLYRSP